MGSRLGIYTTRSRDSLIGLFAWHDVDPATIYPVDPVLTPEAWEALASYYAHAAPEAMAPASHRPPITVGLAHFTVRVPGVRLDARLTTMAQIEEDPRVSFVGNYGPTNDVVVLDAQGQVLHHFELPGAPVAARMDGTRLLIAVMGKGPEPTEAAAGSIQVIEGPYAPARPLITHLKRPVDLDLGDLNGDGRQDLVVCEYGNQTGFLSWYEAAEDGTYRRHVLSTRPGAVAAALYDFDGDGRQDIGALTAQGDEGFDIYYNAGDGRFNASRALRFPPVYGSNHFELADFNADGHVDILYANGDNADITPILKPYHGVRIFLGAPDGSFDEAFFFPLHGAVAAKAADFDGDGDLDIAAISYFPDYAETPEESFVLLTNTGDLTFEARTFEDASRGRWLVMDVGDFDRDQDPDILLGSNIGFAPQGDRTGLYERWVQEAPAFVVLENTR